MHYVHKKVKSGPEIATSRTKTLHFFKVIRLNWLAKIELRGPGAPGSILLLAGVQIFAEHWGDHLQFYPNFALFSTLGGMNLDHDFFR